VTEPRNFLSRWSRRKLEADRADSPEPLGTAVAKDRLAQDEAPAAMEPIRDDSPTVEELAALTRIEDLTAGTDLAPFLRAGVPALLRNAALRRMWSLDPAIRDFVGEARDYSYDWNVPGGVPVSGPLMPSDDVETTLARMFSRSPSDEPPGEEALAGERDPKGDPSPAPPRRAEQVSPSPSESPETDVAGDIAETNSDPEQEEVQRPKQRNAVAVRAPSDEPTTGRRRHGAAIPKLEPF
jgi:hypothetical protein